MSAPPGSTPPPIDPERARESNTAMILTVTGLFHALALVFVAARVYTRVVLVKRVGLEDYIMVGSVLCALGGMIIFIIQAFYGLGKHRETIDPADFVFFSKVGFFQSLISAIAALGLLKISIAVSLLRLSRSNWYKWSLWGLIGFIISYTIMAWCTFLFNCQPLAGFWDKSLLPKCYPIELFIQFAVVNTAFNILTDVLSASLPIPVIWSLQMKTRTRVYLIIILSLGYVAVAMGVVKAVFQLAFGRDPDKTFYQSVQFWGFLQLNIGIIAACAPSLKPLVGRMLNLTSSGDRYNADNLYENRYPSQGLASTRRRAYGQHTGHGPDEYEMDGSGAGSSDDGYNMKTTIEANKMRANQGGVYGHGSPERQGSEESILREQAGANKGIVMTTEISVQR